MKSLSYSQKGQSLIELIIAISVLVVALVATVVLIVTSINASRESKNKLIATNLGREGIEVVRSIRDSNWIDPDYFCENLIDTNEADCLLASSVWRRSYWDEGLHYDPASAFEGMTAVPQIDNVNPVKLLFEFDDMDDTDFTRIRKDGSDYLQGNATVEGNSEFYRMITIRVICRDASGVDTIVNLNEPGNDCGGDTEAGIDIAVEVRWPDASSNKHVTVQDRLYNWQTF